MPDIKDTVGEGGTNNVHDVALVQAMLRVVKDAKGQPYLGGNYDGVYGAQTKNAIERFQTDQKLLPPSPGDGHRLHGVGGPSIQKLSGMLPPAYVDIRIIEKTKTVYIAAPDADAKAGHKAVNGEPNVDPAFRGKALQAVKTYDDYKIAYTVGPSGGRRTFAVQAQIATTGATTVGPGESNHNWGRALDLLPISFRWLKGDGTIVRDTRWLDELEKKDKKFGRPDLGRARRRGEGGRTFPDQDDENVPRPPSRTGLGPERRQHGQRTRQTDEQPRPTPVEKSRPTRPETAEAVRL